VTCALLNGEGAPAGAPKRAQVLTAQFLRLEPGTTIRPHCGMGNFRWVRPSPTATARPAPVRTHVLPAPRSG
jgi:hypothetical protein